MVVLVLSLIKRIVIIAPYMITQRSERHSRSNLWARRARARGPAPGGAPRLEARMYIW